MGSETKWTPGPWEVTNGTDVFTQLGANNADGLAAMHNDGWYIADCSSIKTYTADDEIAEISRGEAKANARLIAAAPELYEALVIARDYALYANAEPGDIGLIDAALSRATEGEAK